MKSKVVIFLILLLGVFFFMRVKILDNNSRMKNHKKQIGTYIIDIQKTIFGAYGKDINIYKKLTLVFYDNNRFEFNMDVPFINDTKGTWKSSGFKIDEWNNIYFDSWDYSKGINGEQFTQCCDSDTTFYFNSMTPQKGMKSIGEIWFKKINN